MKNKGNKKIIAYIITCGPKSTRAPLGYTAPQKDSPPPKNF